MLISFLVLILFFAIPQNTKAASIYSAGSSSPSIVKVYGTYNWSEAGYWDLTDEDTIPDTAVVTAAKVNWSICLSCGMNYADTYVALFNEDGYGYWMDSGIFNTNFEGEPLKQNWSTQFYVTKVNSSGGYITPNLTLSWEDSETSASGKVNLVNSTEKNQVKIEETIE